MRTLRLFAVISVGFAAACSSNGSDGAGSGGAPGAGGAAGMTSSSTGGSGGTPGAGGALGAGGGVGAGGSTSGAGGATSGAGGATDGGTSDTARADAGAGTDANGNSDARADAGGDAMAAYAPCPTTGACIIMPLGDSITDGYPFENGGYRVELFTQAVTLMTPITFVGRKTNGPQMVANMPFPSSHEGYSGYTIDTDATHNGISGSLVDGAISMFHPHIILLHIGTNDINGNVNIATAPTRLAALLDRIIADAPSALLVVAQIIPTQTDATNTRISNYNAAIPALVQQRAAAGKHIALLDMYSVFTANANYKTAWLTDNLHPNVTGYATMGDAWYNALKAVLPKR